jgi:hypothetical protein
VVDASNVMLTIICFCQTQKYPINPMKIGQISNTLEQQYGNYIYENKTD